MTTVSNSILVTSTTPSPSTTPSSSTGAASDVGQETFTQVLSDQTMAPLNGPDTPVVVSAAPVASSSVVEGTSAQLEKRASQSESSNVTLNHKSFTNASQGVVQTPAPESAGQQNEPATSPATTAPLQVSTPLSPSTIDQTASAGATAATGAIGTAPATETPAPLSAASKEPGAISGAAGRSRPGPSSRQASSTGSSSTTTKSVGKDQSVKPALAGAPLDAGAAGVVALTTPVATTPKPATRAAPGAVAGANSGPSTLPTPLAGVDKTRPQATIVTTVTSTPLESTTSNVTLASPDVFRALPSTAKTTPTNEVTVPRLTTEGPGTPTPPPTLATPINLSANEASGAVNSHADAKVSRSVANAAAPISGALTGQENAPTAVAATTAPLIAVPLGTARMGTPNAPTSPPALEVTPNQAIASEPTPHVTPTPTLPSVTLPTRSSPKGVNASAARTPAFTRTDSRVPTFSSTIAGAAGAPLTSMASSNPGSSVPFKTEMSLSPSSSIASHLSGLSPSSGATAPLDVGALSSGISRPLSGGNGTYTVVLAMHPSELGHVQAVMTMTGSELQVSLTAHTEHGHAALTSAMSELKSELARGGVNVNIDLRQPQSQVPGERNRREPSSTPVPQGELVSTLGGPTTLARDAGQIHLVL